MQSLRVRVLDPNGELSSVIGADNTVFIQVIKAPTNKKKI